MPNGTLKIPASFTIMQIYDFRIFNRLKLLLLKIIVFPEFLTVHFKNLGNAYSWFQVFKLVKSFCGINFPL